MAFETNREEVASVGGYKIEIVGIHDTNPELDILKILVGKAGYDDDYGALYYRHEIDDLITVLEYWRDFYPGRGRNARGET